MAAGPAGADMYCNRHKWRFTSALNEYTCCCNVLNRILIYFHSMSSSHRSVTPSFLFCVYFSLSLSASTMMMLIKWTEWIIQIPMAAFLPSVWSAAPLCLLEGIIHLALSLYTTPSRSVHTHTMHTHILLTHVSCLFAWLKGKGDKVDGLLHGHSRLMYVALLCSQSSE